MNKDTFVKIISCLQQFETFVNKISIYINIDRLQELDVPFKLTDLFFKSVYDTDKLDKISKWLYEDEGLTAGISEIEEFYDEYLND